MNATATQRKSRFRTWITSLDNDRQPIAVQIIGGALGIIMSAGVFTLLYLLSPLPAITPIVLGAIGCLVGILVLANIVNRWEEMEREVRL